MKDLKNTILFCALVPLAFNLAADELDETRGVADDATISIENVAGKIDITTWNRGEIHLTGEMGNNQELEITENEQGIHIEIRHIEDSDEFDEAELKLAIPRGASVVAMGVSADISISGSEGESISAESVSGDVTVEAQTERLDLSSVSGDVDFQGSSTRTSVESVAGDIDVEGVSGEVTLSTVSGDVDLEAGEINHGKFDTVSGTLELDLSIDSGGRLTIESMSGDVYLGLPGSQEGEFRAQSFSGDIATDYGQVEHESFGPGSHLKFLSGDSGTTIRIETFSGDIRIGQK